MTVALLILSTICSSPYLVKQPLDEDPTVAPSMPKLVKELPEAEREDSGTWLPYPRDEATDAWVKYATTYPAKVCQTAINGAILIQKTKCSGEKDVIKTQWRNRAILDGAQASLDESGKWSTFEVLGVTVTGMAAAAAVGYLVGRMHD